ncbi:MAG: GNAT family N-acetyltransferase, partial [Candidatus Thiodiazotropha taylori]
MDRRNGPRPRIEIAQQPSLPHILKHFPKMVMHAAKIYLHKPDLNLEWVVAVAREAHTPQGLIVACINRQQKIMRIVSWYVVPEFTAQGLGQQLLFSVESWCREQDIKSLTLDLRDQNATYETASHLLRKQGWSQQQPLVHRFKVAASILYDLNWNKIQRKPSELKTFPWNSLSYPQRKDLISRLHGDNQLTPDIMPFNSEQKIEYTVSLGLGLEDKVIGWVIAHQIRRGLIEYSTLYVDPEKRSTGAAILLLGESFEKLAGTDIEHVIFQVKVDNGLMLRFVRKRFHPILKEATL